MRYSLKEIATICKGRLIGADAIVTRLMTDSRRIITSAAGLFVALKGERHDAHQYLPAVARSGVSSFLISDEQALPTGFSGVVVEDTRVALQQLAAHHRAQYTYPVIAITGSAGKTVVKDMVFKALSGRFKIIRSPRSYNSQIGVPLSIMGMEKKHDCALFEAGISQPGEMSKLADMIAPDIGVFTSLGPAHDEGFGDRQEKLEEKLRLFDSCTRIVYCRDDAQVHQTMCTRFDKETLFSWGQDAQADLHIVDSQTMHEEIDLTYCVGGAAVEISLPMRDAYSLSNAMSTLSLMILLGYKQDEIAAQLPDSIHSGGLVEMVQSRYGGTLMTDQGPIDGPSMKTALDSLSLQRAGRSKVLIMASEDDILNEDRVSRISSLLNKVRFDAIHLVGHGLRSIADAVEGSTLHEGAETMLKSLSEQDIKNRMILLKGSWSPTYFVIKNALLESGHRTVMTVDLKALVHNLNAFRSTLQPGVKLMAMVKAFSYGSGDVEVAQLLAFHHVDYLAVAYADEGVALRKKGVETPIMVMNWGKEDLDNLIRFRLEPEVYSQESLTLLINRSERKDVRIPIHLKVNTGMNRLGFDSEETKAVWKKTQQYDRLEVRSIFSHLLASDNPERDSFNDNQLSRFDTLKTELLEAGAGNVLFHVLNTGGIIRYKDHQHDMVRLGIGLYGHCPVKDGITLEQVVSLRSSISQIRTVPAGETIGYGGMHALDEDKQIAILPIGYADGLSRRLGNKVGSVFVQGQEARFMGNICMDMCMIDISGISCREGDTVELIGPNKSLSTLAEELETIPYEVLTSISQRVRREYRNA